MPELDLKGVGVADHGALAGLSDDDHTIYALLAGRSGGQTLNGGTAANDDLTLAGTSHATRDSSNVIFPGETGLKLWDGNHTVGDGTVVHHAIQIDSTKTYDDASSFPGFVLNLANTLVYDADLSGFASPRVFNHQTIYKSGANATARDLKQVWVFSDVGRFRADTSADTFLAYNSVVSAPTFDVVNAGTLGGGTVTQFNAGAVTVGAGVTIPELRGLLTTPRAGPGTVTKEIGADLNVTEGQTLLRMSRSSSHVAFVEHKQQDGTTSGAATVNFDFPTATDHAYLMRFYTVGHQTNSGLEEVSVYENLVRVKNDGGTVTVTLITQRVSAEVAWTVVPAASGTNVRVACTGLAGDTVSWVCHAEILAEGS